MSKPLFCPNLSFGVAQYKGGANRGTQRAMTASVGAGERQKVYFEHIRNLGLYMVHFKAIKTRSQ